MKKRSTLLYILILLYAFIVGCRGGVSVEQDNANSVVQEDTDPDLRIVKSGNLEFSAFYKNMQRMIQSRAGNDTLSSTTVERIKMELEGMLYIDFRIRSLDKSVELQNSTSNNAIDPKKYMAGQMQYDFLLASRSDTFPCVMYHHENSGNTSPYQTLLLGFDTLGMQLGADPLALQLVYRDMLFGQGVQRFDFTIKK